MTTHHTGSTGGPAYKSKPLMIRTLSTAKVHLRKYRDS